MRISIKLSVYLLFDLKAGRLKCLGENLLGAGAVENELSTPLWLLLLTCSNSQRKTHQIAQIRHFEPQKFHNE